MPVADTLRFIMAKCRALIDKQRTILLASDDPEGIHQTLVALRRLRAALVLFGEVLDDRGLHLIDSEGRRLIRECGPARESHVFLVETAPDAPAEVARVGAKLAERHLLRARQALSSEAFGWFDANLEQLQAGRNLPLRKPWGPSGKANSMPAWSGCVAAGVG